MAKLGQFSVYVQDGEGAIHGFLPGQEVPAWAAKLMGPHCFAAGEEGDDSLGLDANEDPDDPDADAAGPPARAGKGSSENAWRAYAEQQGMDVSHLDSRGEIIAALQDAGVPVE